MVDNNDKNYFTLQEKSLLMSTFVEAKTKKLPQKPFYGSLNAIDELHQIQSKASYIYIYFFFFQTWKIHLHFSF